MNKPAHSTEEEKILILVRHAHRRTRQGRERDNGLSEKGVRQVARLRRYFRTAHEGLEGVFLSSPRRRCVETIQPLARGRRGRVEISPLLLEEEEGESRAGLRRRVDEFCRWWADEAPLLVVACSHGDWIPLAVAELTGARVVVRKAGLVEIRRIGGRARLYTLRQDFSG